MDNDRDIKFDIVIGHHYRSNSAFSKFQHCPISSKFDMWIDNDVQN